jgi:restriction system protein
MIVALYHRAGHKAKRTGRTGDHGVDIVIDAKNGEKWVVQCKRWRGSVGEPVVRDFYGVVQHEKADKGIIFTTGHFSAPAQQWVKGKPISLYDGNKLVEIWSCSKAQQDQIGQEVPNPIQP